MFLASFTGKEYDATGLIYFNARYYDPEVGRFLTEDPARKGHGWYTYCGNNPLSRVDPTGMYSFNAQVAEYTQSVERGKAWKQSEMNPNADRRIGNDFAYEMLLGITPLDAVNDLAQGFNSGTTGGAITGCLFASMDLWAPVAVGGLLRHALLIRKGYDPAKLAAKLAGDGLHESDEIARFLNDYMQGDWENIRFGDVYSHTPPGQVPHGYPDLGLTWDQYISQNIVKNYDLGKMNPMSIDVYHLPDGAPFGHLGAGQHTGVGLMAGAGPIGPGTLLGDMTEGFHYVLEPNQAIRVMDYTQQQFINNVANGAVFQTMEELYRSYMNTQ